MTVMRQQQDENKSNMGQSFTHYKVFVHVSPHAQAGLCLTVEA